MNTTPRHALPLLAVAQAQKEVTHNDALLAIDRCLQIAVLTRTLTVPPTAPVAGRSYIVPATASGAWSGHGDAITIHDGFGWVFTVPQPGFLAFIADEGVVAVFDSGWHSDAWPVAALRIGGRTVLGAAPATISAPAGGAVVDSELRSAFAAMRLALIAQGVIA